MSTMTTPPRIVKLGTSQVRQLPRIRSQVQDVEYVIKVSTNEKKKDELITEDKKAEQRNDEKKSPARKKVKMRKRKQWEKVADLFDQLREEQEVPKVKNENMQNPISVNTWSELLRRKVKGKTNRTRRTPTCKQRLVIGMEFKACVFLIRMDPD